ncbi:GntR family transcriptional regulator [Bordetella trematum]|uniref:GntR family transcriptional regulator n=1 Tax=Bordetella trematum TaxID=123899 RepID=UPI003988BEDB
MSTPFRHSLAADAPAAAPAARPAVFDALHRPNHSGIPKYRLVMNAIAEGIETGCWKPGERLPTEDELVLMTSFSLGTVQRALRLLVDQGLVVREHGLGTFVAPQQLRIQDPWHCRFLADDGESFLPVYSTMVSREAASGEGEWRRRFEAAAPVILIERTINIGNEFDVFTRFYFDKHVFPSLWDTPMEKLNGLNFKKQVTRELKVPITRIDHFVAMEAFEPDVAAHVKLPPYSQGIALQVAASMGPDRCIYYQKFFIPPTRRVLSIPDQLTD